MNNLHTGKMILSLLVLLIFSACSEQQRAGLSVKNSALGKAGSVLVVAEENLWEGMTGKQFLDRFETLYGVLPQGEPTYDIKYSKGEDFRGILKEWRVIIFLGLVNEQSPTMRHISQVIGDERMQRAKDDPSYNSIKIDDAWADGQKVFMFFGQNQAELIQALERKENTIKKAIDELDVIQLNANNYQSGHNTDLNKKVQQDLGIKMDFPTNFELATYDSLDHTLWVRKETGESSNNILVKTMPYTEQSQLTKENLISIRDSLGKKLITASSEGSYMLTETKNMNVETEEIDFKGNYAIRAQGLWKMHNYFMGGPFTSYLIYNKDKGQLVFLDGFVHHPGKSKRALMQQLDLVMNELEF